MPSTRETVSYSASHGSVAAAVSDMATQATAIQSVASSATRPATFLGRADALALDIGVFSSIIASASFPQPLSPSRGERQPVAEENPGAPPGFQGQQFVAPAPSASSFSPVRGNASSDRTVSGGSRSQTGRGRATESEFAETVDGVPQVSAVKPPAKPFYIGLVDVPGVGYANTLFSRNEAGEFDPTRKSSEKLFAQSLSGPVSHQVRSITPAVVRLNVNPTDITLTYAKKVNATRVRASYQRAELSGGGKVTGYVVQHHWDELDTVSVNCVTGNFWVNGGLDYPRGETGFQSGSASRSKSLAYRKLQTVIAMFRNNGCAWITGNTKLSSREEQDFFGGDFGVIVNPGSAFMLYDEIIWYGHFVNMSVHERGDLPHAFEFTLEFKVAKTIDLNGVSDRDVMLSATEAPPFLAPRQMGISGQRPGIENTGQSESVVDAERRDRVDKMLTPSGPSFRSNEEAAQSEAHRVETRRAAIKNAAKSRRA
jgi:hypothetical protein